MNRLLIIGNPNAIHVGRHFYLAAKNAGFIVEICDVNEAFHASWPVIKFNWWLRNKRPALLNRFSAKVLNVTHQFNPTWILTTGLCPIHENDLAKLGHMGIKRVNFLTDDPWNPAHHCQWFMKSLLQYDYVFSPRQANLHDLAQHGNFEVNYLPFAYAPDVHFREETLTHQEISRFSADIMFAGGADVDRLPVIRALIRNNFNLALYGGYWDRVPDLKPYYRGFLDVATLRHASYATKIGLCLIRQANRDGHAMRTFEMAAMGTCMLVEYTTEHREIFGAEGESVMYFHHINDMLEKINWLLQDENRRQRLAAAVYQRIINGAHSYVDRLHTMQKIIFNKNNDT